MRTIFLAAICIVANAVAAESAWQYLELDDQPRCLYQTDEGTFMITNGATVLQTTNGAEWNEVLQLGPEDGPQSVKTVFNAGDGISLLVRSRNAVNHSEALYHTVNGLDWTPILETQTGEGEISELYEVSTGYILYVRNESPAIIWHSVDLEIWTEVYRNEACQLTGAFHEGKSSYAIRVIQPDSIRFVGSGNGLSWKETKAQPRYMLNANNIWVGLSEDPTMAGDIFYSEDGETWHRAVHATSQVGAGTELLYANGVFLAAVGFGNLYRSTNGIDWTPVDLDRSLIQQMPGPLKTLLVYAEGLYWYRLLHVPKPGDTGQGYVCFQSANGIDWTETPFSPHGSEGIGRTDNPLYESLPPPKHYYEPILTEPLTGPTEIQTGGYILKMEPVPGEDYLGLFLKPGGNSFQQVNTAWTQPERTDPYPQPYYIASAGQSFIVLTENGQLGLYDPSADYLAQPYGLSASTGTYDDHIHLQWNTVEGASHYRIYRDDGNNAGEMVEIADVSETECIDQTDLNCGYTYRYQVQALATERSSLRSQSFTGSLWSFEWSCYGSWHKYPWVDLSLYSPEDQSLRILMQDIIITDFPWIWSNEHGWLYCCEQPGSLWLWDAQMGWLWSRNLLYPLLYSLQDQAWLRFCGADEVVRWFWNYESADYQPVYR